MEMMKIMYELANTKTALEAAEKTVRRLNGKCLRKNLVICGLAWFGMTACKMLNESDKKLKESEKEVLDLKAELAVTEKNLDDVNRSNAEAFWAAQDEPAHETDICCDGKASITRKLD